jgi:uncharacterized membrane protein
MGVLWQTIGRFHPVLVHFPLALVGLAVVAEGLLVVRKEPQFGDAARFMMTAAAWMGVPAAIAGFALSGAVTFEGDELHAFAIHRIAGIATPVLIVLAAGMAAGSRRSGQVWELFLYRIFLVLAAASAAVAGAKGGELVWGPFLR